MEPENGIELAEKSGIEEGRVVTLGSMGNRIRSDAALWDELEQAARRVDSARLVSFLQDTDNGKSQRRCPASKSGVGANRVNDMARGDWSFVELGVID